MTSRILPRGRAWLWAALFSLFAGPAPALAFDPPGHEPAAAVRLPGNNHRLVAATFFEYNSAWEPGVALRYANRQFLGGNPHAEVRYATTRLYTAAGSRTLNEDRLRLLGGWQFRPGARVNPSVSLGVGYTRFDREDDTFALLDNDAVGVLAQGGLEVALVAGLKAQASLGFEIISAPTVYPFLLSVGLGYDFSEVLP